MAKMFDVKTKKFRLFLNQDAKENNVEWITIYI